MASMVDPRLVLSVASLLLVLLLPLPAADVECCKKGADHPVKVGGVDISPDSIARGKSATFTISANTVSGLYLLMITECNPNESSKEWSSRALNSSLGISRVHLCTSSSARAIFCFTYSIRNQMESSIKTLHHLSVMPKYVTRIIFTCQMKCNLFKKSTILSPFSSHTCFLFWYV
ncbi:uncharacterized protein LOC135671864 [Musa acuminata AAA Group]|uniref:uncharacterized protein LOC135671864 n=1 Tax=Musa acuminata AAA Group TaxID=214697 RepID=UPI0031D6C644